MITSYRYLKYFMCLLTMLSVQQLHAQWKVVTEGLIDSAYFASAMEVADDGSIWCLATGDWGIREIISPKIYKSTDQGKSWTSHTIEGVNHPVAMDISPIDSSTAYVAYDTAGLYKTEDGGRSWNKVKSLPHGCNFVHFFDPQNGWVLNPVTMYNCYKDSMMIMQMAVTSDGGTSWVLLGGTDWKQPAGTSLPAQKYRDWAGAWMGRFYDATDHEIAFGMMDGSYWYSGDRGYNWTRRYTPLADRGISMNALAIKDSSTIMVSGQLNAKRIVKFLAPHRGSSPYVFTTTDGGISWTPSRPPTSANSLNYFPGSDSTFIITSVKNWPGNGLGTSITYNLGKTWEVIDNRRISEVCFHDNGLNFAAGMHVGFGHIANGQMFKWTNELVDARKSKPIPYPAIFGSLAVLIFIIIVLHRRKTKRIEMSNKLTELQLSARKANIDNTFIFDSLAAIKKMINANAKAQANTYLTQFAKLTRGILHASSKPVISLEEDVELLRNYLSLEKLRYGDTLNYNIDIDERVDTFDTLVPAMVIQSIVEDALRDRHNTGSGVTSLNIRYFREGQHLKIEVRDACLSNGDSKATRITRAGIGKIEERLKVMNVHAELQTEQLLTDDGDFNGTLTTVTINMN